jgi:hypothetical protein
MAYAYGVDLRRSSWLDHSTLGEPLMRGVDRRWNATVERLAAEVLQPPRAGVPSRVLEEIARIMKLLRAPLPTVRLLRPELSGSWPVVTPLGTTMGGAQWLILDVNRLVSLPAHEQKFLLGSGLGNLQCDHGPLFAAHLMTHLAGRGLGLVRTMLRFWSKVAVFSSDRAGLLAISELEPTLAALRAHADPGVSWYPPFPEVPVRVTSLQDFDRSRVMTRLRLLYENREEWTVAPRSPISSGRDRVRSTSEADQSKTATSSEDEGDPYRTQAPESKIEDHDQEVLSALQKAWSLARCDARLTRRLRLL